MQSNAGETSLNEQGVLSRETRPGCHPAMRRTGVHRRSPSRHKTDFDIDECRTAYTIFPSPTHHSHELATRAAGPVMPENSSET